ncbi:hypothetical protein Dimus_022040, partial [Dionaea muscipula]
MFRKEGFPHYEILGEIFNGTSATGGMHNASTIEPPTSDEEKRIEDDFFNKGMHAHILINDKSASNQRSEKFENDTTRRRKVTKANKFDQVSAVMTQWATSIVKRSAESTLRQRYLQAKVAQLKQKESSNQEVNSEENDPYSYKICMEILNKMENISNEAYSKGLKAFKDVDFRMAFVNMTEARRGPILELLVMSTQSSLAHVVNDTSSDDDIFPDESDH